MNFRRAVSWGLVVVLLLFAARFVWYEMTREPPGTEFEAERDAPAEAPVSPSADVTTPVADAEAPTADVTPPVADAEAPTADVTPPILSLIHI